MGFGPVNRAGGTSMQIGLAVLVALAAALPAAARAQGAGDIVPGPGESVLFQVHAEGAQVYECKRDAQGGNLSWQFREPIATLLREGKTVGRHYAGPTWEDADGSAVVGQVTGRAPGASSDDIPQLKLAVTQHRGRGALEAAVAVQRINTRGGNASGACDTAGAFRSVPYAADYVFLGKRP